MRDVKTEGKLQQMRGRIRELWGDITDDDIDRARGDAEQLIGRIKEKTGESAENIRRRLKELMDGEDARQP